MAMTAEQAQSFQGYSATNASLVRQGLDCGCEPYIDVFTFKRWRAQGYHVNRGEQSIRLPVIIQQEVKDQETGEIRPRKIMSNVPVFCCHQVSQ